LYFKSDRNQAHFLISNFLDNISGENYKNQTMFSQVTVKMLGTFFEAQCIFWLVGCALELDGTEPTD